MSNARVPAFVGLDIETTGLDETTGVILEVGLVVFDQKLAPITGRQWLVDPGFNVGHLMDEVVVKMHDKSGLMDELYISPSLPLEQVESAAVEYLREFDAVGLPMVGSSITFDRTWLARHMPNLLKRFHYRSIDATSVRLAALSWVPEDRLEDAEQYIASEVESLRRGSLALLRTANRLCRPHRPLYDICSSAALAQACFYMAAAVAGTKGGLRS